MSRQGGDVRTRYEIDLDFREYLLTYPLLLRLSAALLETRTRGGDDMCICIAEVNDSEHDYLTFSFSSYL